MLLLPVWDKLPSYFVRVSRISARDGRSLIYRADFEVMTELLRFLTEQCCRGIPRRRSQQESA